jgi:four helix bundle protein
MEKPNIILDKTYDFALKIIQLYLKLKYEKEFELGKQLLKSGTSIGANSEEGAGAQSKKDFVAKFSIALKEARETKYWLRLIRDSKLVDENSAKSLISDCEELIRILTAILKSAKKQQISGKK